MTSFKPLNIKKYQKTQAEVTADTLYWKRLEVPTLVKEFGAIDYIDFSPIEPHYFAVTCSVRVQIYNPITKLVVKNLSRFQETAYGGTFRGDGRLLAAGEEQGVVKLFDTSSKNVLRLFRGHTAAVHRVQFIPGTQHLISCGDDRSVRLWDIGSEQQLHSYAEHEDYVRAGAVNPASPNVILSGGYDGQLRLYDTRTNEVCGRATHGSPVESLLFLPTGGIFISAGGTEVRVWDALAGCRLLTQLSQHHKTVTCLRLGSDGKRILSGSLDRHVKIYDVGSYQTVHSLNYPNAVLSLGVAPNDQTVVAGMVDGLISIQNMEPERDADAETSRRARRQRRPRLTMIQADHVIEVPKKPRDPRYNLHLRKYEYAKCLDVVLMPGVTTRTPEVTVSVMQELIQRKGLERALAGRSHASLSRLINFICRHIGEHRFLRRLTDVAMILLDVYEESFSEFTGELGKQFLQLAAVVQKETALTYELLELQGGLELLVEAAGLADGCDEMVHFVPEQCDVLKQSSQAKESSVLTV